MITSKDIFAMRKRGESEQALPLARELCMSDPVNPWNSRAFGWVLYDNIKLQMDREHAADAKSLLEEFDHLVLPTEDTMLMEGRERMRGQFEPGMNLLHKAEQAGKAHEHDRAMALFRQALEAAPDSARAQTGLAWEIEKELAALAQADPPPMDPVHVLLREYAGLKLVEKLSLVHSLVLRAITRMSEHFQHYVAFVRWWGPEHFRPDDFEPYKPEGKDETYDSLVERVIKAVYHAIKADRHKAEDVRWVREFVSAHYQRFPAQEWFPYYCGRLMLWNGERVEAREFALPIVRRKQSEFWAWQLLAETFESEDEARRRACLCRALLCQAKDEGFKVNVHADLADALLKLGDVESARREQAIALRLRRERGW